LSEQGLFGAGEVLLPIRVRLSDADAAALLPLARSMANRIAPVDEIMALWEPARRACSLATTSGAPVHALTRRALSAIGRNPELDRASLARLGRTCPSEIGRYFRRDLGITLVDYRTRLRLIRFIERVDAGTTNLLNAAHEAGFGSYSQLHRTFSALLGCSPRQFFVEERTKMQKLLDPADE
jgi:methylphosphotriester-DNA--protein-cysteine methyltransferase